MKITLNELRQIVKTIIREEMESSVGAVDSTEAAKTPYQKLTAVLSKMNPKPEIKSNGIINVYDKLQILSSETSPSEATSSEAFISFNSTNAKSQNVALFWKNKSFVKWIKGVGFNASKPFQLHVKMNIENPNEIKVALEEFLKQFPN